MTPEQAGLLEKSAQSISAARLLTSEGHHAFAVSRAYYAMFYLAEAVLLRDGHAFSKHSAVIAGFGKHVVKPGIMAAEFHRHLREAQDQRNIADYNVAGGLDRVEAELQVERAEAFLEAVRQLLD